VSRIIECDSGDDGVHDDSAEKIDLSFLKSLEDDLTVCSLDDLFEAMLSRLLRTPHVRQAEIYLFNKQDKLVPVANARNIGPRGSATQKISTQGWIIDSKIRHSTRRVSLPKIFFTYHVPLVNAGKMLGFLNVQLDQAAAPDSDLPIRIYVIGMQLASKIKELMLDAELGDLKIELHHLRADNRDSQLRITSLSKELYAVSAISTRINQSMDLKKCLQKSMLKIKEVFRSSGVIVYLKHPKSAQRQLSVLHISDEPLDTMLFDKIEKLALPNFVDSKSPKEGGIYPKTDHPKKVGIDHGKFKAVIGTRLKSKKRTIGALVLLQAADCAFNSDDLRLLSGITNIMGMAIDNMSLYRQSQQKKKETAFLINSISTFNQKLDLEKTLISVAQKGAEFIGPRCSVLLFSETAIPMVQYTRNGRERRPPGQFKTSESIQPPGVRAFYKRMILQARPSLIRDIGRSKKIGADIKTYLTSHAIQSALAVPLRITGKPLGMLLLGRDAGGRAFGAHDLSVAEALGAAASVAIENARAYCASVDMSEFLERKIGEKTIEIEKIQERQKLRVENRKDIIFRVNKTGRFVFVNKAMEDLTGCLREELYREEIKALDVVAKKDRKRVRDAFRAMLNGECPLIRDLEYLHLNRRGEDHFVSLTIYPERDQLGGITGIEGVGRDITEKKNLEAEIEKTKDLALLGEFSSAIAHQIRNPLGNILIGTKLLQKAVNLGDGPADELNRPTGVRSGFSENKEALSGVFKNLSDGIYDLNQVVTELVEYTKTLKLRRSHQRIETILSETIGRFKDLIDRNKIELQEQFDLDLAPLAVDAVLIGQVFQNIVHNAIQAMPSGGVLRVATGMHPERPGYAMISIGDSGIGIATLNLEKIFRPFYTTKDSGTGLGLALAHRIIDAHGGKIWACQNPCPHNFKDDSESTADHSPDRGITFHILLPCSDGLS
jgi:PAS domain S-box-containing protein